MERRTLPVAVGPAGLGGALVLPERPLGVVLFAHGSGSSRTSPRNRMVAGRLEEAGLGTLLFDLLAEDEAADRRLVFDIPFLAARLLGAMAWLEGREEVRGLPLGLFGSSTGAGAALLAAAREPSAVEAVVSRGGRVDLAGAALAAVRAPTLLIVGGLDGQVLALNREAQRAMVCETSLEVVPGAGHLFEEPGALEAVAGAAAAWFRRHLGAAGREEKDDVR